MASIDKGIEDHALRVGKLLVNLHSLEYMVRSYFLHCERGEFPAGKPLQRGQQVALSAMTDYRSLGQLLRDYNNAVAEKFRVDAADEVVSLRDALAHGRVSTDLAEVSPTLLKFDRPVGNTVVVTHAALMTDDWFDYQIWLVRWALFRVCEANVDVDISPPDVLRMFDDLKNG